jgi:integrase
MKNHDDIETTAAKDLRIAELEAKVARLEKSQTHMLVGTLTDAKIRKLNSRGRHNDSPNLYIQVPSVGSEERSWLLGWNHPKTGKFTQMGLGSYPLISIDQARQKAQHYRLLLLEGKDPREAKNSELTAVRVASGQIKTVREVGLEWWKVKIKPKSEGYARRVETQLWRHVFPAIGDMLINQVDEKTIVDSGPNHVGLKQLYFDIFPTGKQVRENLNRIFKYAISARYCDRNPAAWDMLEDLLPDKDDVYERHHRPSLPLEELYDFLLKLRAYKDRSVRKRGHPTWALAAEFQMFCCVRIGEVLKAKWGEIDPETQTWNVPWQHRKHGRRKRVHRPIRPIPITKVMRGVLDEMQRRYPNASDDALIFPSDRNGRRIPVTSLSRSINKQIDSRIGTHGFRSNLQDWRRLNRTRFSEELYQIQVDHALGDETDQSYGQNLLLELRREMMEEFDETFSKPWQPMKVATVTPVLSKRRRPMHANR